MVTGKRHFNLLEFTTASVFSFGKHVFEEKEFYILFFFKSYSMICFNILHSSILRVSRCGKQVDIEMEKIISNFLHRKIFINVRLLRENELLGHTKRPVIIGRICNSVYCRSKFICYSFTSLRQDTFDPRVIVYHESFQSENVIHVSTYFLQ